MIGFCEIETEFLLYENIDKEILLSYFCSDNLDEIICIVDADDSYKGIITYDSLRRCVDIYDAIIKDYVVFDDNIWENAKQIFLRYRYVENVHFLLPVLDEKGILICFAYEDEGANREVRMLHELSDLPDAMQFPDIFPEIKGVRIYGFNELAFLFSRYLSRLGINVTIDSFLYRNFQCEEQNRIPDYACMNVYAEGIGKNYNWREKLLRSASVEFECIDIIYEANLKQSRIKDVWEDHISLFQRLKEKEILLLGIGNEAQDTYVFLRENGIEVVCFVNNGKSDKRHKMYGKAILNEFEAITYYKNAVFIDCTAQNSAWGIGKVDYYDYIGYKRNKQFIVLKDYVQVTENYLVKSMNMTKTFLMGNIQLCKRLYDYLEANHIIEGYLDMEDHNDEIPDLPRIQLDRIDNEMMCFIVIPEYISPRNLQVKEMQAAESFLEEKGIQNYSDYFSFLKPFIYIEAQNEFKYTKESLMPKRIVLGSIEGCCGNYFFRGLLDNHPSILMSNYNHVNDTLINDNLFLLCVRLSVEEADNILPLFWKVYEKEGRDEISDPDIFNKKMEQLLSFEKAFTSQELFVAFHIAYMYMCGCDVLMTDINDAVIYWEPHFMRRDLLEECITCLGSDNVVCDIVNIVRNICMRNGAVVKGYATMGWLGDRAIACDSVLNYPEIDKKSYVKDERLIVRFEDLKRNPAEVLSKICQRWEIIWSDTLMVTTEKGEKSVYDNGEREITDFDLEPVYNTYEKYFSEFDRLRIMIINAPWQRKYGYPYEKMSHFTKRELQEMFLKEFRFEKMIAYNGNESEWIMTYKRQRVIRNRLLKTRLIEFLLEEMD